MFCIVRVHEEDCVNGYVNALCKYNHTSTQIEGCQGIFCKDVLKTLAELELQKIGGENFSG